MANSQRSRTASTARESAGPPSRLDGEGLLLVAGDGLLETFPIVADEIVIGRAVDCGLSLPHQALSRRHAVLRLGPPITVQDLGSRNGTRVGQAVHRGGDPVPLTVGESFHIGRLSFVLVRAPRDRTRSQLEGAEALTVIDPETPGPLVRDIALSGVNVLILGETGVGKEVLAESLHRASGRKGPLTRINCAALSGTLLESELFGHEKGAFTGATQDKPGLLETARGGTAFLDEVGELPLELQAKLLRVIESRELLRVGAVKPIAIDVRFVAATNRDLPEEVRLGSFRGDLYFRLDGVTLAIPPLRQRRHLIAPLALRFLTEAHQRMHAGSAPRLAHDLTAQLQAHEWPGNVRELKAVCERAVLLARGGEIGSRHLTMARPAGVAVAAPARTPAANAANAANGANGANAANAANSGTAMPPLDAAATAERQRILDALERCAGNQTRAARLLGIARATLVNKLALYGIPRPRK